MQDLANDMNDVEQRSWARLAEWMKQRYHAECSAVSGLHGLASQAAFEGHPLPYHLNLQVSCHPVLPPSCSPLQTYSTSLIVKTRPQDCHVCQPGLSVTACWPGTLEVVWTEGHSSRLAMM